MTTWIPDVIAHEPIESEWGNLIRDRTATPFASAAARTAAIPLPTAGMLTYLIDQKRLEVYDGTNWVPLAPVNRTYVGDIVNNNTGGVWSLVDLNLADTAITQKLYVPYRMTVELVGWVSTANIWNFEIRDAAGGVITTMPPGSHFPGHTAGPNPIYGYGAKDYAAGATCGFQVAWVSTSVLYATVIAKVRLEPTAGLLLLDAPELEHREADA